MALANPPYQWVHSWLAPFYNWLLTLVAYVNALSGTPGNEVDLVDTAALAACTYANGTSGVGATLTGNANGAMATIDGVAPALNKTYLISGQVSTLQNGLYKLTQVGDGGTPFILTRMTSYDQAAEMQQGNIIGVRAGTIGAGTTWKQTSASSPVVGTDAITFARDPGVMTTNTAQTVSAIKTFSAVPAYSAAGYRIADPGTGVAIPVTGSGIVPVTFAGSETNTLAIPTFLGQELEIVADVATSGSRVITVAQAINQAGNNTMTLAQARDYIALRAIQVAGALRWQVVANDGVALSTV